MPVSRDTFQPRNYEDSDLKKHHCKTSKYTCSLNPPYLAPYLWRITPPKDCRSSGGSARSSRLPPDAEVEAARSQFPKSKSKPLEAEVDVEVEAARCRSLSPMPKPPRAPWRKTSRPRLHEKNPPPRLREKSRKSYPRKAPQKGYAAKAPRKSLVKRLRGQGSAKKLAAKAPRKPKDCRSSRFDRPMP